jgi:eukaryotic-like serine/threonine-protein kinase
MTPFRQQQIERIYRASLKLAPEDRSAHLAGACGKDLDLRLEVEALLAQEAGIPVDIVTGEASGDSTLTMDGSGVQLGPYLTTAVIGAGGMGQVFRGVDTRLGRAVAIKISHERFSERFAREARAISSLNHPHICTLYDVGTTASGVGYFVMELVEGETLAARLKRGTLSIDETLRYGAQIADALAAAHSQDITHRDLKPGNLMISKNGIKVLDFGLAKVTVPGPELTRTGVVMGTPAYMAPEQVKGQRVGHEADLFAFGLVLHEMMTGKHPFPGVSLGGMLANDTSVVLPPLSRVRGEIPAGLERLVTQLLAVDPSGRPAAADVRALMQTIASPKGGKRAILVAATAGLVAAFAVVWLVFGHKAPLPLQVDAIRQIAPFPGDKQDPAISPDGSSVAFAWAGEKGDSPGIYLIPTAGGEPRRLTSDADISPAWAPDGGKIAFLRRHPGQADELMVVPRRGGTEQRVRDVRTPTLLVRNPRPILTWMADGNSIVLPLEDVEVGRASLFSVSLDGSATKRLVPSQSGLGDTEAVFSRDGQWLAYYTPGVGLQAQRMGSGNAPQGEIQLLTEGPSQSPIWSPDGSQLLYAWGARIVAWNSTTHVSEELFVSPDPIQAMTAWWESPDNPQVVFSVIGGQPEIRSLTLEEHGRKVSASARLPLLSGSVPAFSWDGRWISFASRAADPLGRASIWMADPRGGHARQLSTLSADSSQWSRDNRHIAVHAGVVTQSAQVYLIDVDPAAEVSQEEHAKPSHVTRQITQVSFSLLSPDWSSDGKYLYATRPGSPSARVVRVPAAGGEVEDLFEGDFPRVDSAGHQIYYGKDRQFGIYSRSLDGDIRSNVEKRLLSDYVPPRGLSVNRDGIFYLGRDDARKPIAIRFFDFALHKSFDLAPPPRGAIPTIAVSPDSRLILYDTFSDTVGTLTSIKFRRSAK